MLTALALSITAAVWLLGARHAEHRHTSVRPAAPSQSQAGSAPTSSRPAVSPRTPAASSLILNGMRLPVSPQAGPRYVDGSLVAGFAASPAGAAYAALHLSLRANPDVGPAVYRPTINDQVIGAAGYLVLVEQDYESTRLRRGIAEGQPLAGGNAVPIGWRIDAYEPDGPTTVHLLLGETGSPVLVDVPVSVVRDVNDWKLLAPATGRFTGSTVASRDGYSSFNS